MSVATPFNYLSGAEGLPTKTGNVCLDKVDVVYQKAQRPEFQYKVMTRDQMNHLFWNIESVEADFESTTPNDTWTASLTTPSLPEPKNRVCDTFFSETKAEKPNSPFSGNNTVSVYANNSVSFSGGTAKNGIRLYNGPTNNEANFIGYSVGWVARAFTYASGASLIYTGIIEGIRPPGTFTISTVNIGGVDLFAAYEEKDPYRSTDITAVNFYTYPP